MQTIREHKTIDISPSAFRSNISQAPVSSDQVKRSNIREFMSWSVCFAIIAGLTGVMKFLKLAVTMETITSILFYLSLSGLIYFISRIIMLARNPVQLNTNSLHELN
jgi:predicted membrane channel-forming protein YqfA (hemolysin III family)